ncbi:glycosyltransferase [Brevundimonas sp. WCHBH090558]|uniref:glycosyltransferase family 4 protein n=1 Tax=Brevundimonas huaxiensis TaxID=2725493 RepID=UPI00162A26D5|nr:glycosyltransferase [Brevundimonas huaxiensis]MBC1182989.1 glycosyltransferase [Brevundimonas huaxiensis]
MKQDQPRQGLARPQHGRTCSIGRVLIEGQFCGFASLSIVNRNLATALLRRGVDVRILPTDRHEGDGEIHRAGLASLTLSHAEPVDVHLRNAWPPVTHGMSGKRNGLVCWAWEESEVPALMAARFNRDLDFILTTAEYVSEALRRSGVTIPCPMVGNGADQILADARSQVIPTERKRLLHISTCLPRKAPEALVTSYCEAFDGRDDVELYIKTSPNPHNAIGRIVEDVRAGFKYPPHIIIDESKLDAAGIGRLYKSATAVVLVSRGEGFGLPLAEAMHLGIPVVAARVGGQADFCTEQTALLVESHPAKSQSHVASAYGLWEEPERQSFVSALKVAIDAPETTRRLASNAKTLASESLTWDAVAGRVVSALAGSPSAVTSPSPSFEVVSTWNEECGLATYSEQLFGQTRLSSGLAHVWARRSLKPADPGAIEEGVTRLWGYDGVSLQRFADKVGNDAKAPVLWFQHHPGYFSADDMRRVTPALRRGRERLIITLHNVKETLQSGADWLRGFDVIVAHSAEDVEELGRAGYRGEVLPHGVRILATPHRTDPNKFVVGSFGFLTEHKNLELLVSAVAQARRSDPRICLVLANAQRVERQSRVARTRVEALIRSMNLQDSVSTNFEFLPDEEIVKLLAPCDLLAFPYGPSPEGASGAARMAIALDRPTLLSSSGVFRDLWPFSHLVRRLDVETLAEALLGLAQDDAVRTLHDRARRRYAETHSWDVVSQRAANLMRIS